MLPDQPRAGPSRVCTTPHGTHAEQSRGHAEDSAGPGASSPQRRRRGAPRPPDPADGSVMQGIFWNSRHGGDGCRAHTTAPAPAGSSVQHAPLLSAVTLAELPPRLGLGRHWPSAVSHPPPPFPRTCPVRTRGLRVLGRKAWGLGTDRERTGRPGSWGGRRRGGWVGARPRRRPSSDTDGLQTVRYRRSVTDGPLPALSLWAGGRGAAAGNHGGHSLPPGGPDTCPPSPAAHGRFCQRHTPLVEARARGSRPRWREAAEGEASHTEGEGETRPRGRGRGTERAWEPGLSSPRPPVFTGSHAGLPRARFAGICEQSPAPARAVPGSARRPWAMGEAASSAPAAREARSARAPAFPLCSPAFLSFLYLQSQPKQSL